MINIHREHKQKLIEKIEKTDNKKLIDEIYRLLEVGIDETTYSTNEEQQNAVSEARRQIEDDEVLSEKEANEEVDKWLKK